jgi:hypothetical protein
MVLCAGLVFPPGAGAQAPKSPPSTQKPKPKPKPLPKAPPKGASPAVAKEPPPPPPKPGLTLRTAYTGPDGQTTETTLVSDGTRQRVDIGLGVSVITQCDTNQILQVNDKAKLYVAVPLAVMPAPAAAEPPAKTGVVTYATTFTDSGETKDILGLSARRVTTVVTRTPTPVSCDKKKERTQTDGWYAPIPVTLACAPSVATPAPQAAECRDEPQTTTTGQPPTGAPLAYTITTYGDDGKETGVARMEVKEITVAPVAATLLEAPAGYTKAATPAEFVAAVERAANEARWGAPKAPGVVRVGVLMPKNKTSEDVSTEAIGAELLQSLSVAPYDAVPIVATTPEEQAVEAKGREVDYVVALDLTALKTSAPGKVGGLLRKASGGGSPTELHEAKVEYRLFAGGGTTPKASKSASAKTGGFTIKQAIGLARFAARIYLGASTGMMRMMLSQNGLGAGMGMGAGIGIPMASADPSMNALSVVFNILGSGAGAPADEKSREATVVSALRSASSDILKELGAKKDK